MKKRVGKTKACKKYRAEKEKCKGWCEERAGRLKPGEYKKECTEGLKKCEELVSAGKVLGVYSKSHVM